MIAATNKNLEESVNNGEFREDLFYRLNVIPITIPPLKERKEDIIPLSDYFMNKYNKKYSVRKVLTPETLQLLQEHNWPGNVRQLENTIERLVIMTEDDTVTADYLPSELKMKHHLPVKEIKSLKKTKEEAERNMIKSALQKYGSIRKAAKVLDVHHSTIIRKMEKYNIEGGPGS